MSSQRTLNVPANSCMEDGDFNPQIHDLLYSNFNLHFAKVSSLSVTLEEKDKKILHGYTRNCFQHTALNLQYFAFRLSDHDFNTVCKMHEISA